MLAVMILCIYEGACVTNFKPCLPPPPFREYTSMMPMDRQPFNPALFTFH